MIKNCSTCRIGAETVDEYPGVCPFYKKHFYKHCGNYAPLEIKASKGRIDVNERGNEKKADICSKSLEGRL